MRSYLAVLILVAVAPTALGGLQPIVTTDLLRVRTVSSIDVAPDGSRVVFAVSSFAAVTGRGDDHRDHRDHRGHRDHDDREVPEKNASTWA